MVTKFFGGFIIPEQDIEDRFAVCPHELFEMDFVADRYYEIFVVRVPESFGNDAEYEKES